MKDFSKTYTTGNDQAYRQTVFQGNVKKILEHNHRYFEALPSGNSEFWKTGISTYLRRCLLSETHTPDVTLNTSNPRLVKSETHTPDVTLKPSNPGLDKTPTPFVTPNTSNPEIVKTETHTSDDPTFKDDPLTIFKNFETEFKKTYPNERERAKRKIIFTKNTEFITNYNEKFWKTKKSTFYLRINTFTDITSEEFDSGMYGGGRFEPFSGTTQLSSTSPVVASTDSDSDLSRKKRQGSNVVGQNENVKPLMFKDWEDEGGITPVREDQNFCNSCAAYAAVTLIENCIWQKTGSLPPPLSVQQLIDCTDKWTLGSVPIIQKNIFCDYGFPDIHLEYVRKLGVYGAGIYTEKDYPYVGKRKHSNSECLPTPSNRPELPNVNSRVTGYNYETFTSEADMEKALQTGPVEARIEFKKGGALALARAHRFYGGGVFAHKECDEYAYVDEDVPVFCYKDGKPGTYDCMILGCLQFMPKHCKRFFGDGLGINEAEYGLHSVVVVGTGRDSRTGNFFWKIKNSWGPTWGQNGYMHLIRGLGHCGIGSSYTQIKCDALSSRPITDVLRSKIADAAKSG